MQDQPYYMIDFSVSACRFEIRVNDIPVLAMEVKGQSATQIPINYAIPQSGEQRFTVNVYPLRNTTTLDSNAEFKGKIIQFDVSEGFRFVDQCCDFKTQKLSPDSKLPIMSHSDIFSATVPYILEIAQNSTDLKNVKNLKDKLKVASEKILSAVENGNYDAFSSLISKREANMATSMYLSDQESSSRTERFVTKFKNGYTPRPISPISVPILCADNRAVMLKYPDGDPAIHFYSKKENRTVFLEVMYHIRKGSDTFEIC